MEVDTKSTRVYSDGVNRRQIDTKKDYTINDMVKDRVFPWTTSRRIYIEIIKRDQELEKALEVETSGKGLGTRYKIKGRSIIKFYKIYGSGINLLKNNGKRN